MLPTFAKQIILLLTNPVFLACVFSWLGAQFLKTVIEILYGRIHSFSELFECLIWRTGGMPSSHSALVSALTTTIGFRNGINSDLFILSFCFFFITIRDSFGVRHSSGLQAKKINEFGNELKDKKILNEYKPIKEVNGHTPLQVILGIVLGVLVGLAFSLLK